MMATKKILLVDDDYDFLESLQLILINDGHDVFPATSGSEAVTRYRELKPDIVFLDIKMPGIDGYETFLRIKKHDRSAKIVFTSSYALDDTKYMDAKAKSLAGLISKPFEVDTLRKMIRRHAR